MIVPREQVFPIVPNWNLDLNEWVAKCLQHHWGDPRLHEDQFVQAICAELVESGLERPVDLARITIADGLHGPISTDRDLAMYILKTVASRINSES